MLDARYTHTNIIARDWRRLADFYRTVFGCVPVPPERDLAGEWLERGTAVPRAALRGMHLRLPGGGDDGPTLEIFSYGEMLEAPEPAANRRGFGHIAFRVPDVAAAREVVLSGGGADLGEVVSRIVRGVGRLTFVYMTDPEGNILELQSWERDVDGGDPAA